MNKIKTVAIASLMLCIVLSTSLIGVVLRYQTLVQQKDEDYRELYYKYLGETRIAYEFWENWTRWKKAEVNEAEISLEDQRYFLDLHSEQIESILNGYDPHTLNTVIMHGCIKTDSNISLPDAAYTYNQLRDGFSPYMVLILPEFNGNLNWNETLQWISTNFTGVPICLSVFEGGSGKLPNPNVELTTAEIEEAMAVSDVKMVRFAEMISWYMSRAPQNLTSIIDETRGVLEFCRSKNLKVLWSEWKISYDVLPFLNRTLSGFEDIVTFVYQTNNEFNWPFIGYLYVTQFEHRGASVQSWWVDETGADRYDLPLEKVVQYAKLATNMGAEIIQFEPYWYFFDDGEPLETMRTIWSTI